MGKEFKGFLYSDDPDVRGDEARKNGKDKELNISLIIFSLSFFMSTSFLLAHYSCQSLRFHVAMLGD